MTIKHFWVDADTANNRLYYVVEHPNMESRNANYERFRAIPNGSKSSGCRDCEGPLTQKHGEIIFMHNAAFFNNN